MYTSACVVKKVRQRQFKTIVIMYVNFNITKNTYIYHSRITLHMKML